MVSMIGQEKNYHKGNDIIHSLVEKENLHDKMGSDSYHCGNENSPYLDQNQNKQYIIEAEID